MWKVCVSLAFPCLPHHTMITCVHTMLRCLTDDLTDGWSVSTAVSTDAVQRDSLRSVAVASCFCRHERGEKTGQLSGAAQMSEAGFSSLLLKPTQAGGRKKGYRATHARRR